MMGIRRDERTAAPKKYYDKLPPIQKTSRILILDPMIATGGTARLALTMLLERGVKEERIALVAILASKVGLASVKSAFSKLTLIVAATDPILTSTFMIEPGLGDFGDRYFGTT